MRGAARLGTIDCYVVVVGWGGNGTQQDDGVCARR